MDTKTDLTGVPETMLQTLYARSMESKKEKHLIYDPMAMEIVDSLDYDFRNAEEDAMMRNGVIARTILLDRMAGAFFCEHPNTVVVNLACGLDTRCYRMEGMYSKWYNLDLPETMKVRKRFFEETETVKQITSSVTDPLWVTGVDTASNPVLILIEGLSMYLSEHDVVSVFDLIDGRFDHATVFIETMSPFVVKHMKEKSIEGSNARFTYGVKNGKELEALIPPFRRVEDRSLAEGMKEIFPYYKYLAKLAPVRNISNKILVFEK